MTICRENDQERVIVEVKSRADLADSRLADIARALENRPGWRFELAVARSDRLSQVEIVQRTEKANQVAGFGSTDRRLGVSLPRERESDLAHYSSSRMVAEVHARTTVCTNVQKDGK